jgi:adenylyltransferase/sulfurtransferase
LREAHVAIVGCGALGSAAANLLGRAGVGALRIIDRDFIELNNLQRQCLFTERDIAENLPKAEAAARALRQINSDVEIEPIVADVTADNVASLTDGVDLVIDGTDNLETRFLVNDACVRGGRDWIYGACIGVTGMMMPVLPGETPCLRCVWPEPPPAGSSETCDTAGILGPVVDMVASWQVMEAIKLLTGQRDAVQRRLLQFDAWTGETHWFDMAGARSAACVCCGQGRYEFLSGALGSRTAVLSGRNAVQISPQRGMRIDLSAIEQKVAGAATMPPERNRFLLRFEAGDRQFTVFADGRAIIKGTSSTDEARSLYAKYVGA